MLEQKIRVISESLARRVDRRTFLKNAGGVVVTSVVALAMGPSLGMRERKTYAARPAPNVPNVANCGPPGPYCNLDGQNEPNGCRGGACFQHLSGGVVQQCQTDYFYQPAGCWTTPSGNGYWTCCDCFCTGNVLCGCAQYTYATGVFPD